MFRKQALIVAALDNAGDRLRPGIVWSGVHGLGNLLDGRSASSPGKHHPGPVRRCVLTLAVLLVAGCGTAHDRAGPAGITRGPTPVGGVKTLPGLPEFAAVDAQDPTDVARAALITVRMIDTTIDPERGGDLGARMRAVRYLSATFAQRLLGQPDQVPPAIQWRQWLDHRAYIRVRLEAAPADRPADTSTTAYRSWTLTTTPAGRDGWRGTSATNSADVILQRARAVDPWRVDQLTIGLSGTKEVNLR